MDNIFITFTWIFAGLWGIILAYVTSPPAAAIGIIGGGLIGHYIRNRNNEPQSNRSR